MTEALQRLEERFVNQFAKLTLQLSIMQRLSAFKNLFWRINNRIEGLKLDDIRKEKASYFLAEMFRFVEHQDLVGLDLHSCTRLDLELSREYVWLVEDSFLLRGDQSLVSIADELESESERLRKLFQQFWEHVHERQEQGLDHKL